MAPKLSIILQSLYHPKRITVFVRNLKYRMLVVSTYVKYKLRLWEAENLRLKKSEKKSASSALDATGVALIFSNIYFKET